MERDFCDLVLGVFEFCGSEGGGRRENLCGWGVFGAAVLCAVWTRAFSRPRFLPLVAIATSHTANVHTTAPQRLIASLPHGTHSLPNGQIMCCWPLPALAECRLFAVADLQSSIQYSFREHLDTWCLMQFTSKINTPHRKRKKKITTIKSIVPFVDSDFRAKSSESVVKQMMQMNSWWKRNWPLYWTIRVELQFLKEDIVDNSSMGFYRNGRLLNELPKLWAIPTAILLFSDFGGGIQSSPSTDSRPSLHFYDLFVIWLVKP